jgi:hypothetical protein
VPDPNAGEPLRRLDPEQVFLRTPVNNAAGLFPEPPLVRDDIVVGLTSTLPQRTPTPTYPPAVLSESNGVVAVDGGSVTWDYRAGELYPLAVLPSAWVACGVGL